MRELMHTFLEYEQPLALKDRIALLLLLASLRSWSFERGIGNKI